MSDATAPTEAMIVVDDIKEWRGQDVVDSRGQKLGKLDEIYYDTETDRPAFAAVKSGTISKHLTLLPLAGATVGRDHLSVSADKDRLKGVPTFPTDEELTAAAVGISANMNDRGSNPHDRLAAVRAEVLPSHRVRLAASGSGTR